MKILKINVYIVYRIFSEALAKGAWDVQSVLDEVRALEVRLSVKIEASEERIMKEM